nr:hypothetical protein GCM10020093_115470 [Planobispora longispora]
MLRTTLDPAAQKAAERAISARVDPEDTEVAAEAMIEPGTGRIRALAASKKYGRNDGNRKNGPRTTFNLAADVAHGGGMGLQAGSTFKVFTLAAALQKGWRFNRGFATPAGTSPARASSTARAARSTTPTPRSSTRTAGGAAAPTASPPARGTRSTSSS